MVEKKKAMYCRREDKNRKRTMTRGFVHLQEKDGEEDIFYSDTSIDKTKHNKVKAANYEYRESYQIVPFIFDLSRRSACPADS